MIKIKGLRKVFNTSEGLVNAVDDVSLEVSQGEFYTLLGPSGCGKSTTLRCVAGLERPEEGEIVIDDIVVNSSRVFIPPDHRPISMVFQSYAIWPHMTVFGNVEFPLKHERPRRPKRERKELVMNALSQVKMQNFANRPAPFLSGGQQQRVALARALVANPKVLLLDEPLSNLDAALREELRVEIKELMQRLGITALYVTHDQLEALTMSDRIAVMHDGKISQEATPKNLYLSPENMFVAKFIGQINFFEGTLSEKTDQDSAIVQNADVRFRCSVPSHIEEGTVVTVAIRPEFVEASKTMQDDSANVLEGKVERLIFAGDNIQSEISWGKHRFIVKLPPTSDVVSGDRIYLKVNPMHCRVFPGSLP